MLGNFSYYNPTKLYFGDESLNFPKVLELDAGYQVTSGPRTTGDGYYESCILGPEGIQIEITI